MKILIVEPGRAPRPEEIEHNLHVMQDIVGGSIQAVHPWQEAVALVCNDEGKLLNLPYNRVLENYDIISGTFFICGVKGADFTSLTETQLKKYTKMVKYPERFHHTSEGLVCIKVVSAPERQNKSKDYES